MKSQISAVILMCFIPCLASAQEQAPKPGPEVQKLHYEIGTWVGHGETKGGPFGPAGKLSSKMTCEPFAGGFQVVCRGEETGPTGTRAFLDILSYDEKSKSYTEYSISSRGEGEYDQGGSLVGNTMTYLGGQVDGGKHVRIRYTEVRVSPLLKTYRAEAALGAAPWSVIAEGQLDKVK